MDHFVVCRRLIYLETLPQMIISNRTSEAPLPASKGAGGPVVSQREATRRGFLKLIVGVLSALVAVAMAVPLIGTILGQSFRSKKPQWVKVGDITSLAINQPVNLRFPFETEDAYLRQTTIHDVWVVKHSSSEVTVFSPICPHLGCHYGWHADGSEFICPCHGSVYSITGKVLGGPAPRPLDTLPWKLEGNVLTVEWETFKVGVRQKIRT
jgi:menaquinol-cytochrome c reductase iron-sulfur subunit